MRRLILSVVFISLLNHFAGATIRRVGYSGAPITGVDYTDFNAAQTASAVGDTIQIYGNVSGGTINKKLVIMGFGYNFDMITGVQTGNPAEPSRLSSLTFDVGSDSALATGLSINSINVNTSNINIQRCYISGYIYVRNDLRPINNLKIISSTIYYIDLWSTTSNNTCSGILFANSIINIIGFNSIQSSGLILNCVTPANSGNWNFGSAGFLVKNCIMSNYSSSNINTIYENNFFSVSQPNPLPQGTNNRWGQSYATIFNRLGGTSDAPGNYNDANFNENYYQLSASSPAINGGFNSAGAATNCGIFGGESGFVFKPGFIPAIPSIYNLTAPGNAASNNPFNITISVKSNN